FVLRSRLDDEGIAVFAGDEDLVAERDGRPAERRRPGRAAALVLNGPCRRIETGHDAAVGNEIQQALIEDRRRHVRGTFVVAPREPRGLLLLPGPNREHDLRAAAGGAEDQPVAGHETWNRM